MSEAIQAREASLKDKQIELGKQIQVSLLRIVGGGSSLNFQTLSENTMKSSTGNLRIFFQQF